MPFIQDLISQVLRRKDEEDKKKNGTRIFDEESFTENQKKAIDYVKPIGKGIVSGARTAAQSTVDRYTKPRSLGRAALDAAFPAGSVAVDLVKDKDFMAGLTRAGTIMSPAETAIAGTLKKDDKPLKDRLKYAFENDESLVEAFQSRNVPGALPLGLVAGMLIPDIGDVKSGAKAITKTADKADEAIDLLRKGLGEEGLVDNATQALTKGIDEASSAVEDLGLISRPSATTAKAETGLPDLVKVAENPPSSLTTSTSLPSYKYNPDTSIDDIMKDENFNKAFEETLSQKDHFDSIVSELAGDRKFVTGAKEKATAADKILRKIPDKPDYTEDSIADLVRGKIVAKSEDDALQLLDELQKKIPVSSTEDYVTAPSVWGYTGINTNVQLPNGRMAELQIHTPASAEIQSAIHPIYTKWRSHTGVIPQEAFDESNRIATEIRAKYAKEVVEETPLVTPVNRTQLTGKQLDTPSSQLYKNGDAGVDPLVKETPASLPTSSLPDNGGTGTSRTKELERKFITTVKKADTTAPEVAKEVSGTYKPIGNKKTLEQAQKFIDANGVDAALKIARDEAAPSAERTAIQMDLMRRFQNEGNFEMAIDVAETAAEQATNLGQTIQALSIWSRLTPEGALRAMQRSINKFNKGKGPKEVIKLSEDAAEEITKQAKEIERLRKLVDEAPTDELAKELTQKTAKLQDTMSKQIPASFWDKLGTFQTFAQLLNPKTAIRNIIGNAGFNAVENVKDLFATPVDILTSVATGKRTKSLPSLMTQAKGFKEGASLGLEEALKGIDTAATNTKFDLKNTDAFKGKVGQAFKKMLDIELKVPDRAFFESAYQESLRQQMTAAGVEFATDEMVDNAKYDALYKTFQDDSTISKIFSGLKRVLNANQSFGLGDFVLKYPKTPGNLLSRSIDYSPAGFIQAAFELFRPFRTGQFRQKQFVESTSRALTGTAFLVGSGAILHRLGIITGEREQDKDVNALKRETGFADYRLNVSALGRLVMSGFDAEAAKPQNGDIITSYDWFQPQSVNFAIGADIDKNNGVDASIAGKILNAFTSSANTLTEQPLLTGVNQVFGYGDLPGGIQSVLEGVPSSFTPTLLKQIAQLMDNQSRNAQDPDPLVKAKNLAQKKVPGVASKVAPYITTRGEASELYQNGTNHVFNVMFNPAFVSRLEEDDVSREVLRLYEQTGETSQFPRVVNNKISINGENVELSGEQIAEMQQYVGELTNQIFEKMVASKGFQEIEDSEKIKLMTNAMTDIHTAAKIELLGHRPERVSNGVKSVLQYRQELKAQQQ